MTDTNKVVKDLINNTYNSTLISLGTIGANKLTTMITKKSQSPLDFKPANVLSLAVDMGISMSLVKWLQDKGYIPSEIMK